MAPQYRHWIATLSATQNVWTPSESLLDDNLIYAKGQLELSDTNYLHWQFIISFKKKIRLNGIKKYFPSDIHLEPTNSDAAHDYVWKDDTSVPNTRFEIGKQLIRRNSEKDWDLIKELAKSSDLEQIPADIFVQYYNNLKRISKDHLQPQPIIRTVNCYWGPTGTGKSRTAWDQASFNAYPKDPRTKFWDGYQQHNNVVIDEFRGDIDIAHLLRWFDRYPVIVEIKGGATTLKAENIWITSNLNPREWYKECDEMTKQALFRRMNIIYFPEIFNFNNNLATPFTL